MRRHAHTRTRSRAVSASLAAALLLAIALSTGVAGGATSNVVVSMDVASAISLTNNCRQSAGYRFGTVQPGTPAITATGAGACSFAFDSSNDTAMLRLYQADQNATPAMGNMSSTLLDQDGGLGLTSIKALDMFDANNGYAVGDGGRVFRTTDGTTWNTVASGIATNLRGVEAVSATTVIVAGNSGIQRSTTSGVGGWTTVYSPGPVMYDIDMAGGQYWAVGNSGTIATSPDGITWTAQASGTTALLEDVDAVSSTAALAAGGGSVLRYAAGAWTTTMTGGSGYAVSGWSATGLVVATGNWGEIRRSTDGGVTWFGTQYGPSPGITDAGVIYRTALVVSASEVIVAGMRGAIQRSTDSGATWTEMPTPTRNFIRRLAANPAGTRFFAVGGGELIADTTDWTTWNGRYRTGSALYDVTAMDAQNAYAVGAHGFIRRTSDGTTWTTPASPTTEHLWAVDSTLQGIGYAVGDNGTVLRTTTGAAWAPVTSPGAYQLRGVAAVDANTVVAVGAGGVIARSTNAGVTWTVSTPVAAAFNAVSSHGDRVVAVGNVGTILVSGDGGATWTDRTGVSGTTGSLRDVSVASADVIYTMQKYENLSRKSVDGGVTWQLFQNANYGNGGYSVSAVSEDVVFGAIYATYMTRTLDGGATPATTTSTSATTFTHAVAGIDANSTWIVGEDGHIAKSQQGLSINDYGGANTWGNVAAPSMFGVCLQAVTGALADWTADATPPCAASDGDPWRALPSAASKVAHTTAAGVPATVTVVWGVRPAANTPAGTYQATAMVEALAPNV